MSNLIFGPGKFRVVLLQDAMGRSRMQRFYAFIETAEGDLAELLVANCFGRVYGRLPLVASFRLKPRRTLSPSRQPNL